MGRHRPRCLIRVVSGHVRKCTASAPTPARSHVSRPERHQRAGRKQTTCQSRASAAGWRDVCRSDQQEPCKPKPQSLPPYSCPKLTTYSCLEFVCEGRSIHRAPRLRRSRSNRSQSGRPRGWSARRIGRHRRSRLSGHHRCSARPGSRRRGRHFAGSAHRRQRLGPTP